VIAVPSDLKRQQVLYSIRKKYLDAAEKAPSISCIQTRLDILRIMNNDKLVIEYRFVIVPITAGIEYLRGLNPDVMDVRLVLARLEELKSELVFLSNDPKTRRSIHIMADWNLEDETAPK
jgi:hypothetical protein